MMEPFNPAAVELDAMATFRTANIGRDFATSLTLFALPSLEIDPDWKNWSLQRYRKALGHPIAMSGFASDWNAMKCADAGVLLLPCGRSAHLEAGYFAGVGKPLYVLLDA